MKTKTILLSFFLLSVGISVLIVSIIAQNKPDPSDNSPNGLKVEINSTKLSYVLGQIVVLDLEVRNEGFSDVVLKGADAQSSCLLILVSSEEKGFRKYRNPAWNKETSGLILKAGKSIKSQATILNNTFPETKHLSDMYIRQYEEELLMTRYAFPKPGTYSIKAVLVVPGKGSIRPESQPIEITVNEPVGEDLEVWNKIKDRFDITYFMQQGEYIPKTPEQKEKFLQEVMDIINSYPDSIYSNYLRQSLEKFLSDEEKLKEALKKVKQPE